MDDKPIRWCSVHPNQSQMPMAMAMTITADKLPSRPKLDYNGGYDVAVKGLSVLEHVTRSNAYACKSTPSGT